MSVAVYSRLAELLEARHMTVRDLQQAIVVRFGRTVEVRALDRLTREARVRRPDMELAAAAATVLGVELGDLFAVEAAPLSTGGMTVSAASRDDRSPQEDDLLGEEQSRRLSLLFDLQDQRMLSSTERAELEQLVAAWARALSERDMRALARERGVSVDQVRAGALAEVERAEAWWREVQADPARLEQAVREARALQKVRAAD